MGKKKRYSYIKNPFSVNGWYCFALGCIAAVLTAAVICLAVKNVGTVSTFMAAVGVSAMLLDLMGLWFWMLSLNEKDKNHIFAMIGGVMSLIVLIVWVIVLVGK